MQLHKSLVVQILLLVLLTYWNFLIGIRSDENWINSIALISVPLLIILIPFAVFVKKRDDWNDFFSVLMVILHPLYSYFIIDEFHSGLLHSYKTDLVIHLWVPYIFQSLTVINYLYYFLKDYYKQYSFYGLTTLSILNHGLILCSIAVIVTKSIQFQSDKSLLNELIAKEIKPMSAKIEYTPKPFFNYFTSHYSTMKVKPNASKEFLLPIRERAIMEYQGLLFESNYLEKKAFSNEILFRSPTDTFKIEIIQSF
ncbi:hypothetical protein [Fluviicola chungangensis]|uniref:Uncharacterized protein n=1 Tax=Fluviicola chungangensis TaxID=2597671 RepID=A0A556N2R0_9FLAO|nr:hypothetical protein [Fluviicola chungangensis]TSJ46441.1 hypothetical protein FO442_04590 [Fluviicola chungangensis]